MCWRARECMSHCLLAFTLHRLHVGSGVFAQRAGVLLLLSGWMEWGLKLESVTWTVSSSPPLLFFSLLTTPSPLPSCIRHYKASEPSGYLFLVFRGFLICFSLYPGQLWHAYTRYVYSWIKPQISVNDTQYPILLGYFFKWPCSLTYLVWIAYI